ARRSFASTSHKSKGWIMRRKLSHGIAGVVGMAMAFGGAGLAHADVNLWINDASGNIGLVDVTTGVVSQVHATGQDLTDIGFIGTQLYGTTFTGLYAISTSAGAATSIGTYTVGGGGMNAL